MKRLIVSNNKTKEKQQNKRETMIKLMLSNNKTKEKQQN